MKYFNFILLSILHKLSQLVIRRFVRNKGLFTLSAMISLSLPKYNRVWLAIHKSNEIHANVVVSNQNQCNERIYCVSNKFICWVWGFHLLIFNYVLDPTVFTNTNYYLFLLATRCTFCQESTLISFEIAEKWRRYQKHNIIKLL